MNIETVEVDSETLSAHKTVEVASRNYSTPAKALQVGKLRASEKVSPLARGVAEIYRKGNATALKNSRTGWDGLAKGFKSQADSADDDELVVPFFEYDDTAHLTEANAAELVKLQTNYGDIITVPLMTPLVDAADDGDDRTTAHVSSIIDNTRTFLKACTDLKINKPVMGVIPPISEDCTNALVSLYLEENLRAFCVDFSRRSPMAQSQIDNVSNPMMQMLENYDVLESSLIYAVNAHFGRTLSGSHRTPDTVYAYTLGYDIVGDNHIAPNLPESVLEDLAKEAEQGEIELRLFDADTVSFIEVPVSDLHSFLPPGTDIPVRRVRTRVRTNSNERYRFEKLINTELISLYLDSTGGVSPSEIFAELTSSPLTQDSDIERVLELADTLS
ncbi:hypothetical protein SAMN05216226_104224 [Halovenus aranensis]|uniref:Uncharacterized protein n=1 Tax=Halovenus aranensis TaxID=890420 RepID=A0A1G8UFJ9_9EURY|nr:hypothetical protein [Halovenus aranensis]SDJ52417.1 hypothetical protein SAMN05216226_104224 [Halovenus aranensis]